MESELIDSQDQNPANSDQNQPSERRNKWLILIISATAVLSLIIVFNIILTVFIISNKRNAEPREAVLVSPSSDDEVPCGLTPEDLKLAVESSKQWAKTYIKESLKAAQNGDMDQARENVAESLRSLGQLITSGRVTMVPNGTSCMVLESNSSMSKIKITEGHNRNRTYWVYKKCLAKPFKKATTGTYIATGIWVYVRYLVTALICCLGIYYLRIKSFIMQVLFFFLSFIILSLILNKIIVFFMY